MEVRIVSVIVQRLSGVNAYVTGPVVDIPALVNVIRLPTAADEGVPNTLNGKRGSVKIKVTAALFCVPWVAVT